MTPKARAIRMLAVVACLTCLVAAGLVIHPPVAEGRPPGIEPGWSAGLRGRAFFSALLDLGNRSAGENSASWVSGLIGHASVARIADGLRALSPARPAPPDVEFLGESAVVLSYDSVYDVHDAPDPAISDARSQAAGFDTTRILNDLAAHVDASQYDFCLLYTVDEVPGWVHAGPRYSTPAANIGLSNSGRGRPHTPLGWPRLRSAPHMNSLDLLTMRLPGVQGLTGTVIAFHEIGHYWGVRMARGVDVDAAWTPEKPIAWLGAATSHWTRTWIDEGLPGIMSGTPTGRLYNAFDLYAMGLMGYEEASTYAYAVERPDGPNEAGADERLTLDDLIYGLSLAGGRYYSGDGRRDPDTDESARDLRALLVVVKGRDEQIRPKQEQNLLRMAEEMPAAWSEATWGRSTLQVQVIPARGLKD